MMSIYRKTPKNSDIREIAVINLKFQQGALYRRVKRPKDADGIANRVDPDQTAPLGAGSWSALLAQTCLSENLGSLG